MAGFSEDELAEQIVRSAAENVKAGVKVPEQPTRSKNRNFVSSAEAIRIIKLFVIRKLEGIEPAFDPQFKPAETGSYKECSDRENRSWRISERELGLSVDTTDFDVVGMNFDSITPDETYEVTDYIKDLFGSGTVPAYFKGSGARLDPCSLSTDKSIRTLETGKSSTWSAEQMRPDKLFSSNSPEYRDAIGAVVIDLDELRRGLENTNPQAEPGQKIVRDGDGGGPNAQYPTVVAPWVLALELGSDSGP